MFGSGPPVAMARLVGPVSFSPKAKAEVSFLLGEERAFRKSAFYAYCQKSYLFVSKWRSISNGTF
jgi:hypothetical protein